MSIPTLNELSEKLERNFRKTLAENAFAPGEKFNADKLIRAIGGRGMSAEEVMAALRRHDVNDAKDVIGSYLTKDQAADAMAWWKSIH